MTVPPRARSPKAPAARPSRAKKPPVPLTVLESTETAIAAATHLTAEDAGAVATLRYLAKKIDTEDQVREAFIRWQLEEYAGNDRPSRPLQLDNVSVPTYLKFCDSLGLTPAGRTRLVEKPKEPAAPTRLAKLRSVSAPRTA